MTIEKRVDTTVLSGTGQLHSVRQEQAFYEGVYRQPDDLSALLAERLSIREVYALDLLGDCHARRVLDVGSGGGRHAVEMARRGAIVLAADVAVQGLQQGRALAGLAGQLQQIHGANMDAHRLALADGAVDLVFGAQVLHHLDCASAGAEIGRVLKPGGRAVFIENSDRNPVLRWARRHLMGRFGIRRYGSVAEAPLNDAEIDEFCQYFGGAVQIHFPQLCLTVLLARHWLNFPWAVRFFTTMDRWLERWIPALRPWSFLQVLEFTKAPSNNPTGDE